MATPDKRGLRIKEVFQRYDKSGDGFLDIEELNNVLKTLGSFSNQEVRSVCADLDKSNDGQVSFKEFEAWVRTKAGSGEAAKAKAILAPSDDDGLEGIFYNFCGAGHADMDGKSFSKMCKDCNLLTKKVTEKEVDILFSNTKVKQKTQRRIQFPQFEIALELLAEAKGMKTHEIRNAVVESTGPIIKGTEADAVRLHDDKSTYTGTQAQGLRGATGAATTLLSPGARNDATASIDGSPKRKVPSEGATNSKKLPLLDTVIDNRNTWKAFGIDSQAGRSLKALYSEYQSPKPTAKGRPAKLGEKETFVAVDNLQAGTPGLHFRRSRHLKDVSHDPRDYVPWGECVKGERIDACWISVEGRFLPVEVQNIKLLRRWQGPGDPPRIGHSNSLPDLRRSGPEGIGSDMVTGVPFGRHVTISLGKSKS